MKSVLVGVWFWESGRAVVENLELTALTGCKRTAEQTAK